MAETVLSAAAERNKGPILDVLRGSLPSAGAILEVASGTGQHVLHFAAHLPTLVWQPTERLADDVRTLELRCQQSGLSNIRSAQVLDVLMGFETVAADYQAILCINMIHIAPAAATGALFAGAARVLEPGGAGIVVLYGPFKEGGVHTAESNAAFDASLQARHPDWGVRDLDWVIDAAGQAGFAFRTRHAMPSNNRVVVFARS